MLFQLVLYTTTYAMLLAVPCLQKRCPDTYATVTKLYRTPHETYTAINDSWTTPSQIVKFTSLLPSPSNSSCWVWSSMFSCLIPNSTFSNAVDFPLTAIIKSHVFVFFSDGWDAKPFLANTRAGTRYTSAAFTLLNRSFSLLYLPRRWHTHSEIEREEIHSVGVWWTKDMPW